MSRLQSPNSPQRNPTKNSGRPWAENGIRRTDFGGAKRRQGRCRGRFSPQRAGPKRGNAAVRLASFQARGGCRPERGRSAWFGPENRKARSHGSRFPRQNSRFLRRNSPFLRRNAPFLRRNFKFRYQNLLFRRRKCKFRYQNLAVLQRNATFRRLISPFRRRFRPGLSRNLALDDKFFQKTPPELRRIRRKEPCPLRIRYGPN